MTQHKFQIELTPNTDGRTQADFFSTIINCESVYDGQALLEAQYGTAQGKANIMWLGEVD
jgi:hypothetical protein